MAVQRSVLAVPGNNWRMIEKAIASDADTIFLDLEDAVAPDAKAAGRATVIRALTELDWGRKPRIFRVNALDTPFCYRDLVDVVEAAGDRIDRIIVPKVGRPEDVAFVDILLTQLEAGLGLARRIGLEVQIESAEGVLNCARIAAASPRITALVYGPGDYSASVRMPATAIGAPDEWDAVYPGHRYQYVLHRILVAARAAGVRAIDGPFADFRDPDGCRRAAMLSRAMGYDGKWCIHPSQIPIVNEVFSPTPSEIVWAQRVVAAYEAATREGRGAIAIDGRMIDAASIRMAQTTLDLARAAGLVE
ncbi:MAG: CoA ester lyase [Sphaerobacter sp.]|nr:CoA ester lyase [Sphaerobacter sp.]